MVLENTLERLFSKESQNREREEMQEARSKKQAQFCPALLEAEMTTCNARSSNFAKPF
jgi:hypothetical protein